MQYFENLSFDFFWGKLLQVAFMGNTLQILDKLSFYRNSICVK